MFAHLPIFGNSESKDYVMEDLIATRWKPLRDIGRAVPIRERLDELQIHVVMGCTHEDHRDVRPFAQQSLFFGFIICGTHVRPYRLLRCRGIDDVVVRMMYGE